MDDQVPVDGDHVMTKEGAGSPRNWYAGADMAEGASANSSGGGGDNAVPRAGVSVPRAEGDGSREQYLVSQFGQLESAGLPGANAVGSERDRPSGCSAPGASATGTCDFPLMYAQRFFREDGEGVIPERVYEGNYDQLVGYLRGPLDQ